MTDEKHLATALGLAADSAVSGGRPFGAIATLANKVIGTGVDRSVTCSDPTEHAEMSAIREAGRTVGLERLRAATVYTSCEPCVMCAGAILRAGIARVVFAADRPTATDLGYPDVVPGDVVRELLKGRIELTQIAADDGRRLLARFRSSTSVQ
jgi:guanine deaminase